MTLSDKNCYWPQEVVLLKWPYHHLQVNLNQITKSQVSTRVQTLSCCRRYPRRLWETFCLQRSGQEAFCTLYPGWQLSTSFHATRKLIVMAKPLTLNQQERVRAQSWLHGNLSVNLIPVWLLGPTIGIMAWTSSLKGLKTVIGRMVKASAMITQPQLVPT